MNIDKLEKAKGLAQEIRVLEAAVNAWKTSRNFGELRCVIEDFGVTYIPAKAWLEFRSRVVEELATLLAEVKKEFEEL